MLISAQKIKDTVEFTFQDNSDDSDFAIMTDAIGFLIKWAQEQTKKLVSVSIINVEITIIQFTIYNINSNLAETLATEYNSILMHWKLTSDTKKKVIN